MRALWLIIVVLAALLAGFLVDPLNYIGVMAGLIAITVAMWYYDAQPAKH